MDLKTHKYGLNSKDGAQTPLPGMLGSICIMGFVFYPTEAPSVLSDIYFFATSCLLTNIKLLISAFHCSHSHAPLFFLPSLKG